MGKGIAQKSIINMVIYHIINMMLVSFVEAKYLVAGNPLSFNNHLSQETVKGTRVNNPGYGNIIEDWAIRRLTF